MSDKKTDLIAKVVYPENGLVTGERIYLREVKPADAEGNYHRWMNDAEVVRFLESRFQSHTVESLKKYIECTIRDPNILFLAIVLKSNNRHIGNVKVGPIDWVHRLAGVGIIIGEKECWGKGYASEAIKLVTDYAFNNLKLHKLIAGAYKNNKGSARIFSKAGYTIEGVWKDHYMTDSGYEDSICFARINPAYVLRINVKDEPGNDLLKSVVLRGPNYLLTPFNEKMISEQYIGWLNDSRVNKYLEVRKTKQTQESVLEFVRSFYNDPLRYFWGIYSNENSELVGTATLYLNRERQSGEIGLLIGEVAYWGKKVSDEVIDLIAQFTFEHLGLCRVTGGCYSTNIGMNFTFKKLGFKLEGILRKCRKLEDGTYLDEFLWGALADEWKVNYKLSLIGERKV